jgi:hypothetical protein
VCASAELVGVVTVLLDFMLVRFLCEGVNSLLLGESSLRANGEKDPGTSSGILQFSASHLEISLPNDSYYV